MIEITIPRLGWSMDDGTFAGWLKSPGEFVNKGDFVFELEGEKAIQEVESFDSGVLCVPDDAPSPGDTVRVGQVIGFLLAEGDEPPASLETSASRNEKSGVKEATAPADGVSSLPESSTSESPTSEPATATRKRVAGPAARRLARQLGIDLNLVATPDPTGRVISEDVKRAHLFGQTGLRASRTLQTPRPGYIQGSRQSFRGAPR